jgi:hypothetical protein
VPKEKRPGPAGNAASVQRSAAPPQAREGWAVWYQPKVLIPLVSVTIAAVTFGINYLSKSDGGVQDKAAKTSVPQPHNVEAAPAVNVAPHGPDQSASAAAASRPPRKDRPFRAPSRAAPQYAPARGTEEHSGVNIHVNNANNSIVAGNVTANTIEMRPQ